MWANSARSCGLDVSSPLGIARSRAVGPAALTPGLRAPSASHHTPAPGLTFPALQGHQVALVVQGADNHVNEVELALPGGTTAQFTRPHFLPLLGRGGACYLNKPVLCSPPAAAHTLPAH